MRLVLVALVVVVSGCAASETTETNDDGEASAAPAQELGKEDSAAYLGQFRSHATRHYNGDVPALELRADGSYIRARCYHASCALQVAETDHYDTYTSSSGKSYIRFWSFTAVRDADDNLTHDARIADVYEVRTFSHGIQVRKAYSSRWQSLYTSSPSLACAATGGTWASDACTCAGNDPTDWWPNNIFIAGAGGCMHNPGTSEENCDATNGEWTDDDATLTGSYCLCGFGRYLDDDGACAEL
ncbi:MAG TPA: hypothetical protein VMZ53_33430 [Kofleriaceae bacterium]|nr:hypothetical protein [Kofleriaceae bacterium]